MADRLEQQALFGRAGVHERTALAAAGISIGLPSSPRAPMQPTPPEEEDDEDAADPEGEEEDDASASTD
jgi:hypothetical protein